MRQPIVCVRIPADLRAQLEANLAATGMSVTEYLMALVSANLQGAEPGSLGGYLGGFQEGYREAKQFALQLAHAALANARDSIPDTLDEATIRFGLRQGDG